jgi:hypothetical protein
MLMTRISIICLTALTVVAFPGSAAPVSDRALSGQEAFTLLKSLSGEWQGTAGDEKTQSAVTVTYRVTSAGSAVIETLFPGGDHEMVTLYTLDRGKLYLTHYCAMANQPRMVLNKKSTAEQLIFDFAGGTNFNPRKDAHMHSATFFLRGPDSIQGDWVSYEGGKKSGVTKFSISRKK